MKTRLLSVILAASFALSLAGCAGGGGSPAQPAAAAAHRPKAPASW